jgi:hypothetical protein
MTRNRIAWVGVLLTVVTAVVISQALSQVVVAPPVAPAAGDNAANADRQARMTEFRKQMMDQIKEVMAATDDEWKVIQPKIEKVQQLQRDAMMAGMGRMFRGPRNGGAADQPAAEPPPPADNAPALEKARYALDKVLKDKAAKAEAIKVALTDYRKARDASKVELEKAQVELKELLTARQEALLVVRGVLN